MARDGEQQGTRVSRWRRPGGTAGGVLPFLVGLGLTILGAFLIMNQTIITSGYWGWWGANTFGLTLIPLFLGVALLFYNNKSLLGWVVAIAGLVVILAGVLSNLHMYFQPTTLFNTVIMFALFAGGLGLMARGLK